MLRYKPTFGLVCGCSLAVAGNHPPPPPPPTFRKSAQLVGNFRLCRNFKTIEYTEIDRKNDWRVRQLISIERRLDYLVTICLICCVNHISHFCACSYLLKEPKRMKN